MSRRAMRVGGRPSSLPPSAMPTGNLAGWTYVNGEDFDVDMPVGSFASDGSAYLLSSCAAYSTYYSRIRTYADATPDTSGNAQYYPSKTLSVSNSCLNIYQHSETISGTMTALGGSCHPSRPDGLYTQTYGRWAWRMREYGMNGPHYGCVANAIYSPTWPSSSEVDWPEGDVNGTVSGFYHYANPGGGQTTLSSGGKLWSDWHNYVVEWSPGLLKLYIDGTVIYNTSSQVSYLPLAWLIQSGSTGGVPDPTTAGTLQIDWMVTYDYAPAGGVRLVNVGTTAAGH